MNIKIPKGWTKRGDIPSIDPAKATDTELEDLFDEDMLQIEVPNGLFTIDVGWYPDWNPQGEYRLVVYRETFENQIEYPIKTNNVTAIKVAIEQLAKKYSPAVRFMGGDSLVTTLFVDDCNVDTRFRVAV